MRPEDLGHKNPSLTQMNAAARETDAVNRNEADEMLQAMKATAEAHARRNAKTFMDHQSRQAAYRQNKALGR